MARSLSLLQLNPCFHCFHPIVVRICLKRLSSASPVGFERFPAQRLWQSDSISQVSQRRRARGTPKLPRPRLTLNTPSQVLKNLGSHIIKTKTTGLNVG